MYHDMAYFIFQIVFCILFLHYFIWLVVVIIVKIIVTFSNNNCSWKTSCACESNLIRLPIILYSHL